MPQRHAAKNAPRGLSLIEIVIGIALVAVLIGVFGVSLTAAVYAQRVKHRNMAGALAEQALGALEAYDPASLPDQTNGALLGVLYPQGTWGAAADAAAPSAGQVLSTAVSSATGVTSILPLPKNAYADFTLSSAMRAPSGAPAGWKMGFMFRANDLQNGYRLSLSSSALLLEKLVNGTATTLYTDVRSVSTDSWQTLAVTTNGSNITVSLNGLNVTTQNDSAWSSGKAALLAWEGAGISYDDVSIDGTSWNFDALAPGDIPDDWLRFGLSSLPNGSGRMTVTTPYSDTSFKQVTVTITWSDKSSGTKSVVRTAYIN